DNPLSVESGTLVLQGQLTFTHDVTLADGTILDLEGAGTVVILQERLAGSGAIQVHAGSLVVAGQNNPYAGAVTLLGGGVRLLATGALGTGTVAGNVPTTALSSDPPASAPYGELLSFTATVSAAASAGTPGGSVQFRVDGAAVGNPVPLSNGSARLSTLLS